MFARMTSSKKQITRLPLNEGPSRGNVTRRLFSVFNSECGRFYSQTSRFCGAGIHLETLLVNRRPRFLLPCFF